MGRNKIQRNNYLNKVCECLTCNTLITDTEELTLCKCKSTFIRMICWTRKKYCLSCSNNKLAKLTIDSDNKQSLLSCDDLGALAVASTVSALKEDEYDNKQLLLSSEDHGALAVASTVSAVKEDEYDNKQSLLSCEDHGALAVASAYYEGRRI